MKHYKHIFFDLDRTLWDFEKNSHLVLLEIFDTHQLQDKGIPNFEDFYQAYHTINHDLWDQYRIGHITKEFLSLERFFATIRSFNVHDETLALQMSKEYVEKSPLQTELFPGTHELLQNLSKRYHLHLITNGFAEVQFIKLEKSDLAKYFEEVIISEQTPWKKPRPEIFKYALNQADAKAEESIMIGDDIRADIKGAASVGMDQIWTNFTGVEASHKATYEVTNLIDILEII